MMSKNIQLLSPQICHMACEGMIKVLQTWHYLHNKNKVVIITIGDHAIWLLAVKEW